MNFFLRYKKEFPSDLKLVLAGKAYCQLPDHPDILPLGFLSEEDKYSCMAGARVLVMPSPYESLSIVTLESLAVGTPVIVNGKSDVLHGHCKRSNAGLYYKTYHEFASVLGYMLVNDDIYTVMRENGKKYITEYYSNETVIKKINCLLEFVYAEVLIMRNREMVKIAYNLILGREPESEEAYNREFVDLNDLKSQLMGSQEYLQSMGNGGVPYLHAHQIRDYAGCMENDVQLVSEYADLTTVPDKNYFIDFTGIKTSANGLNIKDREGVLTHNLPFPDDSYHAHAVEYASLYYAISETAKNGSFTMFEVGAGWGPWMAYTAKACKTKNISTINIVGIEGEENKIPLIKEHLYINGFRQDNNELSQSYNNVNSRIIHGVVTEKDGVVEFPEVDVKDYGASITNTKGYKMIKVSGYSLETLMRDFKIVDFMHIDIQGHETDVINSACNELNRKVRFLCIGTHSRKIEGELIEFLFEQGWELLREMPCVFNRGVKAKKQHIVELTTMDGLQFWKNPKI